MSKKKQNKRQKKAALRQQKAKRSRHQQPKPQRDAEVKWTREDLIRQLSKAIPPSKPKPSASKSKPLAAKPDQPPLDFAALKKLYDEFQSEEDYEARIALFIKMMDEGLMDELKAFHMLNQIHQEGLEYGNEGRDRLNSLLALLRERLPDIYQHDAQYYLEWLVSNAFATNRLDNLPELADQVSTIAGKNLDCFYNIVYQFAYHNELTLIVRMMRNGYPYLQEESDKYHYDSIRKFTGMAITYEILAYVEENPIGYVADPHLRERIVYYAEGGTVNWDNISNTIDNFSGQGESEWTMADFGLKDDPSGADYEPDYDDILNLVHFTMQFLHYLRHSERIGYAKGEQTREMIHEYLLQRQAGKLSGIKGRKRRRNRKKMIDHFLVPDAETLDRYLGNLMNLINPQLYSMASFYQLLPAWLRYLESRNLIDATRRDQALEELREMKAGVLNILDHYTRDPALLEGIKNAF